MLAKKRLMIIAHFCDVGSENTNNRFNYIANMLSYNDFEVELVTSSFCHREKKQRNEVPEGLFGYHTTLIHEPSYQKNISLKRLFVSHRVMADNLKKYLLECIKPDLIYCAIPSINVAEVAKQYAEQNGIPFVIDIQDLWPEAYRLILKNETAYKLLTENMKKRVNQVYAAADSIVAVSNTYAERAKSVNKKCYSTTTVFLGTDMDTFDRNIREHTPKYSKPDGEIWIGYCGTLGRSYDLSRFMEELGKVMTKGYKNLRLIVIGSGPLQNVFQEKAKELNLSCIFTGQLPYGDMCAQLCECDIAINPIARGAAQSIINKHADYAMASLPVISTQDSGEYSVLLNEYRCGFNCYTELEIQDAIVKLVSDKNLRTSYGANARKMAEERFDRRHSYSEIIEVIQTTLDKGENKCQTKLR